MLRMIKIETFGEKRLLSYDFYRNNYFRLVIMMKPLKDLKRAPTLPEKG
jgi:hypothetical protein